MHTLALVLQTFSRTLLVISYSSTHVVKATTERDSPVQPDIDRTLSGDGRGAVSRCGLDEGRDGRQPNGTSLSSTL